LAHRALATKPPEYFLETHRHLFEKHDEQFGAEKNNNSNGNNNSNRNSNDDNDEEGLYLSTDILTFHNLVTHDKTGQKQPPGNNSIHSNLKVFTIKTFFYKHEIKLEVRISLCVIK